MIDFFHKQATLVKRVSGIAKLKGAPVVHSRPARKVSMVGTFKNEEDAIASLLLEVADTPESRRLGLMKRESLPQICGMLFDGLSGGGYFWMKNCLIPLDVAFMDKDGLITKTYSMPVDKEGEKHYEYEEDDVTAVETNMGFLKKWGIVPGCKFRARKLSGKEDSDG